MIYELRYANGTPLGDKYPHWVIATFRTLDAAQAVRRQCTNSAQIVVVPVEIDFVCSNPVETIQGQESGPETAGTVRGRRPPPAKD